jgi:hypothetical protein
MTHDAKPAFEERLQCLPGDPWQSRNGGLPSRGQSDSSPNRAPPATCPSLYGTGPALLLAWSLRHNLDSLYLLECNSAKLRRYGLEINNVYRVQASEVLQSPLLWNP